jgi:16S rRNA (guanine1207-N2)-methyltransferase
LTQSAAACVYGAPPPGLATAPEGARQVSPLIPGSEPLEALAPASLAAAVIAAPPGTLERRYVLALTLRALRPGGALTVLAAKDKGGARLRPELEAFGCEVEDMGRQHQRICHAARPDAPIGLAAAIAAGGPQRLGGAGLWTQPGVFSWDREDPGSRLLVGSLPALSGHGADLGCGIGVLARAVLASPTVTRLALVENDRRALDAARRNVEDSRANFHWADVRQGPPLEGLDFVVTNPPFHADGVEDKTLGQAFIRRAKQVLRRGGALWIVANRHLPYEAVLGEAFGRVALSADAHGYKVYEARA